MNKQDIMSLRDEYKETLAKKKQLNTELEGWQDRIDELNEQLADSMEKLENLLFEIGKLDNSLLVKLDKILVEMEKEDEKVMFKFKNESSLTKPKESVTNENVSSSTKEESSSKEDKKATEKKSKNSCYDKYIKEAASYLDPWELKLLAKLVTLI